MIPLDCALIVGPPGCRGCGGTLKGRRRVWCSEACETTWLQHHYWAFARLAALRRDGWTCCRCGYVAWQEVPSNVLGGRHEEAATRAPDLADWARAFGYRARAGRFRWETAYEAIPEAIEDLVRREHDQYLRTLRRRHASGYESRHPLEVNHRDPRRGRGYQAGCHNHLDKLETLCHPCHVDETTRQIRGLPGWRQDPRPMAEIEGRGRQGILL